MTVVICFKFNKIESDFFFMHFTFKRITCMRKSCAYKQAFSKFENNFFKISIGVITNLLILPPSILLVQIFKISKPLKSRTDILKTILNIQQGNTFKSKDIKYLVNYYQI